MAIERALVVIVLAIVAWRIIRYGFAPVIVWALKPRIETLKATHARLVAESRLRVANEDANTVRIEAQIASVSDSVITELTGTLK
jgi:hypothetical protein